MSRLLNVIKQAGVQAVEAGAPVAILYGTVDSVDPLAVNVDQRFTVPASVLIVPESLIHFELDLRHDHGYTDTSDSGTSTNITTPALSEEPIVIRRGLEVGDKVILIRVHGGQKYVILDRVVEL